MEQIAYFLGANTPQGFYSLTGQMLDPDKHKAIYILKGGAGCGKSTLMKHVAKRMTEAGEGVEHVYCSGDPDSLDALLIPGKKAAIVDGTAPHVVEPRYPGAVERYVNLGRFYDSAALAPHREKIEALVAENQGCYRRAYRCLKGAGQLLEDNRELLETRELREKIYKRAKGIIAREIPKSGPGGDVEERFLDAVSCQGRVCLFETVSTLCKRVYELEDSVGAAHLMLSELLGAAMERGHSAIVCPDPMAPKRLRHLLLPELGVAFVTGTKDLPYPGPVYRRVRLDAMADAQNARRSRGRVRFTGKMAQALLEEGMDALARAKTVHDDLEAVYNPHVDFDGVNAQAEELAQEILAL